MVDPVNDPPNENFYQVGKKYSVTLNPPNCHQYFGKPLRFSLFYDFVNTHLVQMGGRYVFYIELSEPRGFKPCGEFMGPRLHLHGIVYFETKEQLRMFLESGYYSLTRWTSTDMDTIDDLPKWKEYIRKQRVVPSRYRKVANVYGNHRNANIE